MRIQLLCCCAVLTGATCFAQAASEEAAKPIPVATVGGQPILDDELTPLIEGQLRQLQYQEYLARRKALDDVINQKLIAGKAAETGLAPEEFLRQTVDNKLPEPGENEVKAFYFRQRNLSNIPFDQVKAQVLTVLKQQNVQRARQEYFETLRESADVKVMLQPPRVRVSEDAARELGSPDAPVSIVEFADFECPYCQKAFGTMKELVKKYDGQVRLSFRDFPLEELHPGTRRASEAARCATEQGKFWAYHDLLFTSSAKLSDTELMEHAREADLDVPRFNTCLKDRKVDSQIDEDVRAGIQAGVSGTPAFFINGVFLNGYQPLSAFESAIDQELASLKGKATKVESPGN